MDYSVTHGLVFLRRERTTVFYCVVTNTLGLARSAQISSIAESDASARHRWWLRSPSCSRQIMCKLGCTSELNPFYLRRFFRQLVPVRVEAVEKLAGCGVSPTSYLGRPDT
jgi:hypothetical protein